MEVGIVAIVFGLAMLGIIKLYEMCKRDVPRPFFWLVLIVIAAISLYLASTRGCTPEKFV
jgi:hypothetical protein